MELTEPILALLAAVFGGVGLKVIESLLSRSSRRADVAKEIRDELREEATGLRDQLDSIESRLDKWKRQYYDLYVAFNEVVVLAMGAGLVEQVNEIRKRLESEEEANK